MKAVIFDIDNTLSVQTDRHYYDWSDLSGDEVIIPSAKLLHMYKRMGYYILLVTGRPEFARANTEQWLNSEDISFDKLYMKQGNQYKSSVKGKRENLNEILATGYSVEAAFDDDIECCNMYMNEGIMIYQPLNFIPDGK